jgi:hypothetical protein
MWFRSTVTRQLRSRSKSERGTPPDGTKIILCYNCLCYAYYEYCAYYTQILTILACISPSTDVSPRLERNIRRPDQTPHLSLDMRRPNTETFSIRGTEGRGAEGTSANILPYATLPKYPSTVHSTHLLHPSRRHAAYHSLPHHTSPHITSQRQPAGYS